MTKLEDEKLDNDQLVEILDSAIENFRGDLTLISKSIGALVLGRKYGWKVMYLIHSKRTIKKYEEILGVSLRDVLPAVGKRADKSLAWSVAKKVTNFWKAVSGEIPGVRSPDTVDADKKKTNKKTSNKKGT